MCGLVGFCGSEYGRLAALAMLGKIRHRGPDHEGTWVDSHAGVALGHARLSVVDLSASGNQPMHSASGRWVITYNGEIYNFRELRLELNEIGVQFNGGSDTEVVVEAVSHWGVERTLAKLIGMFAMALWDRDASTLYLVRDHLGIKPLYWALQDGVLMFASELKALKGHPNFRADIDRTALTGFFRHGYVPAPSSIYVDTHKLQPGHFLKWSPGSGAPKLTSFWSLRNIATEGRSQNNKYVDDSHAIDELDQLLRDAVGRQMVADVPLGALLSGGVDSSLVAALMQSQSPHPVKTFSIGFGDRNYDEARFAKTVAQYLQTDHAELYVEPGHALDILPKIPSIYDEPFADSSQIPTYIVSELTKAHVTVALSGDGGDELFAGYNRYFWGNSIWNGSRHVPIGIRKSVAMMLRGLPLGFWNRLAAVVPSRFQFPHAADKVWKVAGLIEQADAGSMYRQLVSYWADPESLVINGRELVAPLSDHLVLEDFRDLTSYMQYLDSVTYLPDDILTKVDRASMAVSLEMRVPLLDHRVVEYAWRQPVNRKIRDGQGKWLLRQVLDRYVPRKLIDRPKMGFSVPVAAWLRGPLRDWAEPLLSPSLIQKQGYLRANVVQSYWAEHLSGKRDWSYRLWAVLMFQAWLENESRASL